MTDTPDISKEAVERDICTPIINYVADGRMMSEDTLAGIIAKSRAMSAHIAAQDAKIAKLEVALSDTCDALDLANKLLKQTPVTYAIPLTNQFNARHAAAERGRQALASIGETDD